MLARLTAPFLSVRLLHVTIFATALLLSVKMGDVWTGLRIAAGGVGIAETHAGTPSASLQLAAAGAEKKDDKNENRVGPSDPVKLPPGTTPLEPSPKPSRPANANPQNAPDSTGANSFTQTELDLLQDLANRRAELDRWSEELDLRDNMLRAAEDRMAQKVQELKALHARIDDLIRKYDEQEEAKMRSLVKIYENMKPKDAARIFEQLDMPILLDVVERMKEAKVAPILADMDPLKAKTVTAELAQRRQMPKETPGG